MSIVGIVWGCATLEKLPAFLGVLFVIGGVLVLFASMYSQNVVPEYYKEYDKLCEQREQFIKRIEENTDNNALSSYTLYDQVKEYNQRIDEYVDTNNSPLFKYLLPKDLDWTALKIDLKSTD